MAQRQNRTTKKSKQNQLSGDTEAKTEEKKSQESKRLIDIGLDISTAVIGYSILDHVSGELIHMGNIKLNSKKFKTMWEKADFVKERLDQLELNHSSYSFKRIFVEANAKRFTPGFSSADTILTLAKFNGIVSFLARGSFYCEPIDVNVVSARAKLGIKIDRADKNKTTKEKVREEVKRLFPDLPYKTHIAKTGKNKGKIVLDKEMEDEIDSFVIARGGQEIHKLS